jgi:TonB dependent receptor/TonB-dependent Receptor Plug Domain/CarboxypepD_reg-like domain
LSHQILEALLKLNSKHISLLMKATLLIVIAGSFLQLNGYCQSIIRGKVVDKMTRESLELAVVSDLKSGKKALTDKLGNFLFKSQSTGSSLAISFIGYKAIVIQAEPSVKPLLIEMEKAAFDLTSVTVTNHSGINTTRTLSYIDMNQQPAKSAQDLLRLVPGLFIAQHQGGGKAEQIFLRGFDADHGTDVNVSVDGLPVNMVSHAHGQGYADMHFLIPETVAGYDFGKGPYFADRGDFTTAGYVAYNTKNVLDRNMVKLEAGQFNHFRLVTLLNLLGSKAKEKGQSAYIAGEALYSNGPFDYPEHFNRFNLFGKFITPLNANNQLTLSLTTLSSTWRASGEIPNRAVAEGYMKDRFGVLDSAQGGYTSRTNVNFKLSSSLKNGYTLDNQVYYSHYEFNLVSNFTFYYFYPETGDEFRQFEIRDLMGYNSKISKEIYFGNASLTSVGGLGVRDDQTHPSQLDHTVNGTTLLNHLELGRMKEINLNGYLEETLETGKWLFNAGLRLDYFNFYYFNELPGTDSLGKIYQGLSPTAQKAILSPKINIQYSLNPKLQVYLRTGKGFHSNDARIVIVNEGYQVLPAAYGMDLGINWKPLPRLFINTAIWYLFLQQEFTYGADLGDVAVQPGGRTRRIGIDFSGRYQISDWLYINANINLANPREIDSARGSDYLPLAPTFTSTAGFDFKLSNGLNGGLSYRYLHNRAANSTYSLTALGYFIADLSINYTQKKYEIGLSVENLFNQTWNESQFEYTSRLKNELRPVDEVSYTPGTPFFAKLKLALFF